MSAPAGANVTSTPNKINPPPPSLQYGAPLPPPPGWNNLNKSFTPKVTAAVNNSLNPITEGDECVSSSEVDSNSPSKLDRFITSPPAVVEESIEPAATDIAVVETSIPDIVPVPTTQQEARKEAATPQSVAMHRATSRSSVASVAKTHTSRRSSSSKKPRSSSRKKRNQGSTGTASSSRSRASNLSLLPIWRRENPNNALAGDDDGDEVDSFPVLSEKESGVHSETSSLFAIDELPLCQSLAPGGIVGDDEDGVQRIGIPMSQKKFDEMMVGGGGPHDGDDGYSSSSNSVLSEEMQLLKKYQKRNGKLHYPVSYNGVTFDLLSFTMVTMQKIVTQCGACESSEAMCKFFDFIAAQADKLNADRLLRSKHHLGKGADWLELKKSYAY